MSLQQNSNGHPSPKNQNYEKIDFVCAPCHLHDDIYCYVDILMDQALKKLL
jgi:hypothetical protein